MQCACCRKLKAGTASQQHNKKQQSPGPEPEALLLYIDTF